MVGPLDSYHYIDGLLASYDLNGDASDEVGNYDGSVSGAEVTTDRFSSTLSAYRFNGKDDYVDLGPDFTEGFDSLSVSIWIYPFTSCESSDTLAIEAEDDQYFLSSGGKDESTGIYAIWNKGALLVGQSLENSHSEHEYHAFLDDHKWHHIVMFFDAENEEAIIYVNGVNAYSLDYISGISSSMIDALFLGGPNFEGVSGFHGKVDDVKIYHRKLSELEINELYTAQCPDSLVLSDLHIHSDTLLYANSMIQIDSLEIDSACTVDFITSRVHLLDSSFLNLGAQMKIWDMEGCRHSESIHDQHTRHRGIYVNNFVTDGVLGNALKEDSLIQWCLKNEFNNAYLYNIGSALSSGMQVELDNFVEKANDHFIDITFVSAGYGTSFSNIEAFHDDYENIPQGIVSEIEFWNGSGDYDADYAPWLDHLDSLKYKIPPGETMPLNPEVFRRFYIGKIKNPGQAPSFDIAEDLIMHHDEIFLTNYHSDGFDLSSSTSENSIVNKLSLLGKAARNLDREVNVVILFNVRQDSPAPNIWTYYSEEHLDHDFRAGYEKWYHDFIHSSDIEHKEYINLKGYGVYRWTDAREARF
ncbi:hypothetical protein GCM10007940_21400 [Portibacter lacus]|uniref:LamG-like jellyroll fold domain-containing protein n=2 Tax=Portibacter lacus TaxID=1099794 RepID=A0AA37ST28_9BACT|nr:hypothetical protein GCM10007940_21400 [Portibacter lacus]